MKYKYDKLKKYKTLYNCTNWNYLLLLHLFSNFGFPYVKETS